MSRVPPELGGYGNSSDTTSSLLSFITATPALGYLLNGVSRIV
jgi:hypothetical protein